VKIRGDPWLLFVGGEKEFSIRETRVIRGGFYQKPRATAKSGPPVCLIRANP